MDFDCLEDLIDGVKKSGVKFRVVGDDVPADNSNGCKYPGGAPAVDAVQPVDFLAKFDPAPLPMDTLPMTIQRYVADNSRMMGVDPAAVAMGCIVVCASQINDGIRVQPKRYDPTWLESARLWGAIVGDPSTKKTPALTAAVKVVKKINHELAEVGTEEAAAHAIKRAIYEKELKAYTDAMARGANDANMPDEPEAPRKKRAMMSDTTTEAMANVLADNEQGILVFHDELAGFFGSMDAYRNNGVNRDRPLWLQAYNGGSTVVDRVGKGTITIPNWSACILGGIQPDPMRRIASKIDDDGLLQRFMIVMARRGSAGIDTIPDLDAKNDWEELVHKLGRIDVPAEPFRLSSGALKIRERMAEFSHDAQSMETFSKSLSSHFGKWDGLFARLLLTWHVVEHAAANKYPSREIAEGTAAKVERFMREFLLSHAIHFYTEVLRQQPAIVHAEWIAGHILAEKKGEISKRDITMNYRALRTAKDDEVAEVMSLLESFGWVTPASVINGRTTKWAIDPAVHAMFADRAAREAAARDAAKAAIARTVKAAKA